MMKYNTMVGFLQTPLMTLFLVSEEFLFFFKLVLNHEWVLNLSKAFPVSFEIIIYFFLSVYEYGELY